MESIRITQGRQIGEGEIELIRGLMAAHPEWNRTRLSRELCARRDWCNAQGHPKDMAARTLLLKLERAEHLRLPAQYRPSPNARRNRVVEPITPPGEPIRGMLHDLQPLAVSIVAPGSSDARLFLGLLAHEHYFGQHITQGTRGLKGRQTCERLWTVVGTCAMQGRSAFEFILAAVSAHFRGEPAPFLLPALG